MAVVGVLLADLRTHDLLVMGLGPAIFAKAMGDAVVAALLA